MKNIRTRVLKHVRQNPGCLQATLPEILKISKSSVSRSLSALVSLGLVTKDHVSYTEVEIYPEHDIKIVTTSSDKTLSLKERFNKLLIKEKKMYPNAKHLRKEPIEGEKYTVLKKKFADLYQIKGESGGLINVHQCRESWIVGDILIKTKNKFVKNAELNLMIKTRDKTGG